MSITVFINGEVKNRLGGLHSAKCILYSVDFEEIEQFQAEGKWEESGDQKKLVQHYSGGMKRRLSLAIALINQPQYLILDEPTVGIDPVLKLNI